MLEERSSIGRTTSDEGNITAELLPEQGDVTCWTCGSEVKTDRIKETIDHLRDRLQTKLSKSGDLDDRLDELKIRRRELREEESRRQRLNDRIADIDRELEERTSRVEDLEEREEELITDVEELESRVQALENEDFEGILDLHRTANQVELEIEQIESQRQSVDEEIAEIESRLEEVDELENRRETINLELEDLRTRVEQLERDAVEAFNQHMNEILGILEYDNLERIWIERTEQTVRKGRRKEHRPTFDLHVVRQTDNGATYEDTIDHLSESERKVTGLVFALAGYLVHDVHEELPFILLDSVEASDAQRIVALVDHFQDHADFLVVALLEEDAQALNESSVDVSITSV
jgi:DNA repair exonuclease SbcCD ATPase subunit